MEAEARHALTVAVLSLPALNASMDVESRVAEVQRNFAQYKKVGERVVDEFIAERRRMWSKD
jgi:hypothetical protein